MGKTARYKCPIQLPASLKKMAAPTHRHSVHAEPDLFMNELLRPSIAAKSLGVLPPRAQRAVKHACARSTCCKHASVHPALSLLLPASLRPFTSRSG